MKTTLKKLEELGAVKLPGKKCHIILNDKRKFKCHKCSKKGYCTYEISNALIDEVRKVEVDLSKAVSMDKGKVKEIIEKAFDVENVIALFKENGMVKSAQAYAEATPEVVAALSTDLSWVKVKE